MSPVEISVPGAEVLYNSLYEDQHPSFLIQDIAAIKLPDGTLIDVSWYPQFDPKGSYTITHYDAACESKLAEMTTRCVAEVVESIRLMARHSQNLANGAIPDPGAIERISQR